MGRIVNPGDLQVHLSKLISAKKQIGNFAIDLTVRGIYKLRSAGALDFGGSEYRESPRSKVMPTRRNPEDSYGWWDLLQGDYLVEFNERLTLEENQIAFLQPHPRVLDTGCFFPAMVIKNLEKELSVPFHVPEIGVTIKENSRVAQLIVIEL